MAYAESADGRTWVKPNLRLFPYYEVEETNIVLIGAPNAYGDRYCNSVLVDPRDPDPARRYKMAYYDWEPDDERNLGAGTRVAFSPDGIHWTKHEGMGRIESQDFIQWSKPQFILGVDDNDPPQHEFHTSPVFLHNGQYFSLNQILNRSAGHMDIELMSSRDGFQWDRPYIGVRFLERGTGAVFDAATLLTNATPHLVGDEMWFYYGGYRGTAIGAVGLDRQVIGGRGYFSGIGLAMMKRDRFVAVVPDPAIGLRNSRKITRDTVGKEVPKAAKPNTIGQVTLRPLDLSGVKSITINADATKGKVAVELLNEDGYRVRGFSKDDAVAVTGDALAAPVTWKERTLAQLKPGRYMLRVHLEKAELFAITLNREPTKQ